MTVGQFKNLVVMSQEYWPYWYGRNVPVDGYYYGDEQPTTQPACQHEWVNVSFNLITMACKHCGQDKED